MTTTLLAILAVVFAPLVGYIAAARKLSGKVETSEASQLWEESRSIRQDYARRIEELNDVLKTCQERIETLEKKNDKLYLENGNLKHMIEEHEKTISELRQLVHDLGDENKRLRDANEILKARVTELEAISGTD